MINPLLPCDLSDCTYVGAVFLLLFFNDLCRIINTNNICVHVQVCVFAVMT